MKPHCEREQEEQLNKDMLAALSLAMKVSYKRKQNNKKITEILGTVRNKIAFLKRENTQLSRRIADLEQCGKKREKGSLSVFKNRVGRKNPRTPGADSFASCIENSHPFLEDNDSLTYEDESDVDIDSLLSEYNEIKRIARRTGLYE